jgi:CheY-like chemotaxis protein
LKLSSEPGRGTRAELWLPTTTEGVAVADDQSRHDMSGQAKRIKVLVVDDDALILMSTAAMVEDLGHDVIEVSSGSEALEVLKGDQNVDLLITDFSMPKMNGAQLASAAKELLPDLPILLATGFAQLPDGGDVGLPRIAKPYQQEQLATAISETLATHTCARSAVV